MIGLLICCYKTITDVAVAALDWPDYQLTESCPSDRDGLVKCVRTAHALWQRRRAHSYAAPASTITAIAIHSVGRPATQSYAAIVLLLCANVENV